MGVVGSDQVVIGIASSEQPALERGFVQFGNRRPVQPSGAGQAEVLGDDALGDVQAARDALVRQAADAGLSVPELLRRELTRIARRPTINEWLARTERRPSTIDRAEILDALDEIRGELPAGMV